MAKRSGSGGKRKKDTGGGADGGFLSRDNAEAPSVAGLEVGEVEEAILASDGGASVATLLVSADKALTEDYDYDRALSLLRLAARKGGDTEAVEALARFLVESYARYDEAIALLQSPRAHTDRHIELRRLLADALFNSGRAEEALPLYETIVSHTGDHVNAELWLRVGTLREAHDRPDRALRAYREAQRLDPGSSTVASHVASIEAALADASASRVEEARAALDAGDPDRARELAQAIVDDYGENREAAHLLREIATRDRVSQVAALVASARAAEAHGDSAEALDRWREVQSVDEAHEGAAEAVPRLEREVALRFYQKRLSRGLSAVEEGRYEDAIQAFYRAEAVKPPEASPPTDRLGSKLYEVTADFLQEVGARQLDRAAPALAALCRAELALDERDVATAEALAREAAPALGSLKRLEGLRHRLQEIARVRELARADEAYEDAERLETDGDISAAAEAFERALSLGGADFRDAQERATTLRDRLERADEERRLHERMERLEDEQRWFELRRLIDNSPVVDPEDPAIRALRELAESAIEGEYSVALSPPPWVPEEGWGRCIDSRDLELPDLDRSTTRVLRSTDGRSLIVLSGPILILVDTKRLTVRLVADLSPWLSFGAKGELVLLTQHPKGGHRIVIVSEAEEHLVLLHVTDAGLQVEDHVDVSAVLSAGRDRSLRYYGLHGPSERLVQLETRRDSNGPSTLRNINLLDGKVVHEEQFNYGIWNLFPFPDDDLFVVNRVPDYSRRRRRGYFTFGLMDHRGRLTQRVYLRPEDVPEPMERIHSLARSKRLDRLYLTYDYYDPLGNVVRHNPALMVIKGESDVFYQSPSPERLLSGKRLPKGTVRVIEHPKTDGDVDVLLVLPHTEAEGQSGVSVLGGDDLKLRFDLGFEEDEALHSLHEAGDGTELLAFTFPYGDGAWRVRRLLVDEKAWSC